MEVFTPALVDGLSMDSEWQRISSGLKDSSKYPSRSFQYWRLDSLDSSTNFQFLQSLLKAPQLF